MIHKSQLRELEGQGYFWVYWSPKDEDFYIKIEENVCILTLKNIIFFLIIKVYSLL